MIKILIGGSPCTHWSIAQTKHRETEASGIGWELFKNYLIAKEKFKPDLFLYENNKSAAQAIKDQISAELGVELMYINSALVSAQNRQRFYAFNWSVEQPQDRGILLRDILETTIDKRACVETPALRVAEATKQGYVNIMPGECVDLSMPNSKTRRGRAMREKSNCLTTSCGMYEYCGTIDAPISTPACLRYERTEEGKRLRKDYEAKKIHHGYNEYRELHPRGDGKSNTITTVTKDNLIIEKANSQGGKTYEVINGEITINGKKYTIQIEDGTYIIRKLTVTECCRLQTLPDYYCKAVSNSQAYKGLGNGWTAEVIIHILRGALENVDRNEKIIVLSMYDGIGTGRYCLQQLGFNNIEYYAYEIDKYPMTVANDNFPDIVQCGDAFDLRNNDWTLESIRATRLLRA